MKITMLLKYFAVATAALIPSTVITTATAFAANSTFVLKNQTSANLVEFYISPANSDGWGNNIIPEGRSVVSGGNFDVTIQDNGKGCLYDILGVFDNGSGLPEYNVNICEISDYTYN